MEGAAAGHEHWSAALNSWACMECVTVRAEAGRACMSCCSGHGSGRSCGGAGPASDTGSLA
eukprot:6649231-Prymnesium_polylepis.1